MKVILRQDIDGLGKKSDIVDVSPGHARNYLLPRKLALQPTTANMRQIELEKVKEVKRQAEELEKLKLFAEKMNGVSCTVAVKVGEEGQMYGSVSAQDISNSLKNDDVDIDPRCIILETPIKELGVYSFTIRLAPEVEATSTVWVVQD